jgi:prepilin-type N-terminal cleavage/methylation domain-containing protein
MKRHATAAGTPPRTRRARGAFTLVELLVVVAILALLVSMLSPTLRRVKELTRRAICGSNLNNVGTALTTYAAANGGKLPPVGAWVSNGMMMYVLYEFNPGYGTAAGFNSLGILQKGGFLPVHTDVLHCPSTPEASWLRNPNGDRNHGNCLPWNGGGGFAPQPLLPGDEAAYGWVAKRSGFIRRTLGETGRLECKSIHEIGSRSFLADVFNSWGHVNERHVDGVSVWYGNGSVRWTDVSDPADWPDGSYASTHENLRYMWEHFDNPSPDIAP